MAISRYDRTARLKMGHMFGTQRSMYPLYHAVQAGTIASTKYTVGERERLDILAGKFYGDGRYWWVIAAASGVGWALQVPPGIVLSIPTNIGEVEAFIG
jgi:nucleoid-associated protein YgaU